MFYSCKVWISQELYHDNFIQEGNSGSYRFPKFQSDSKDTDSTNQPFLFCDFSYFSLEEWQKRAKIKLLLIILLFLVLANCRNSIWTNLYSMVTHIYEYYGSYLVSSFFSWIGTDVWAVLCSWTSFVISPEVGIVLGDLY